MSSHVYVAEQGAVIKKLRERLTIRHNEEIIFERHFRDVGHLFLYGNVQITTQVMTTLLSEGIGCSFYSLDGRHKGNLVSTYLKGLPVKMAQVKHWKEGELYDGLSRTTIIHKIRLQEEVLRRRRRLETDSQRKVTEAADHLSAARSKLKRREFDLEADRGSEGFSARMYFSVWPGLMPDHMQFNGRSRRPANDEVNSLMNFIYTIFMNDLQVRLDVKGFDTIFGFYHRLRSGRASLTLDVLEVIRPILDQQILKLIREKRLRPEHFEQHTEYGFLLSPDGRRTFFSELKKWKGKHRLDYLMDSLTEGLAEAYLKGDARIYDRRIQTLFPDLL